MVMVHVTERIPSGSSRSVYSSGVTGYGGPSFLSLLASTGKMSVASCPPGLMSCVYLCAHFFLLWGCRAHRNLRSHTSVRQDSGTKVHSYSCPCQL